jgi:hypothetical protein
MSTTTFTVTIISVTILVILIDSGLLKSLYVKFFKREKSCTSSLKECNHRFISQVDYTTLDKDFDDFIDNSFVEMCKSRNKIRHKVEYDNIKWRFLFI